MRYHELSNLEVHLTFPLDSLLVIQNGRVSFFRNRQKFIYALLSSGCSGKLSHTLHHSPWSSLETRHKPGRTSNSLQMLLRSRFSSGYKAKTRVASSKLCLTPSPTYKCWCVLRLIRFSCQFLTLKGHKQMCHGQNMAMGRGHPSHNKNPYAGYSIQILMLHSQ